MAVLVVDLLEVVDVGHDEAGRLLGSRIRSRSCERELESSEIEQTSQVIALGIGCRLDPPLGCGLLRILASVPVKLAPALHGKAVIANSIDVNRLENAVVDQALQQKRELTRPVAEDDRIVVGRIEVGRFAGDARSLY
jgi:hypothetical protein